MALDMSKMATCCAACNLGYVYTFIEEGKEEKERVGTCQTVNVPDCEDAKNCSYDGRRTDIFCEKRASEQDDNIEDDKRCVAVFGVAIHQSNAEGMPAQDDQPPTTEGSWTPFLLICAVLVARWLASSKSDFPIKFRRWLGKQKVQARKKFGYRDEEKYKMSAGSGADQRLKRQG